MKISEITDNYQTIAATTTKSMVKVGVNGLLMSKATIADESSTTLSAYEYVADDDDILRVYRNLSNYITVTRQHEAKEEEIASIICFLQ